MRIVGDLGIPIAYGLRSGHVSRGNVTLAIRGTHGTEGKRQGSETSDSWTCDRHGAGVVPYVSFVNKMSQNKHIHLIGICGTAMASLAGMLRERGLLVTGSDAAAYPPMSDFLASLGISVAQPFAAENLRPKPDLVVVGNAISRGNVELEKFSTSAFPLRRFQQLLHDEFLARQRSTRCRRDPRQDHNHIHACLDISLRRPRTVFSDWRYRRELWQQLPPRQRQVFHHRRR